MTQLDDPTTSSTTEQQIADVENQISQLTARLEEAKREVQAWVDENTALSLSVQAARAKTQSRGRGLGGALLGSKYRASARRLAATENAQIAQEVAAKRAAISEGKKNAQEVVREIQAQINLSKEHLKQLKAHHKSNSSSNSKKPSQTLNTPSQFLVLLEKLKEAHELGLLTQEEYEEKRRKIVNQI